MSRLTCAQCEGMLLDAADSLLLAEDETHFRLHLADCPGCSAMFADVQRGSAWMDMLKAAPPVPPEGLVDRILAATSGDPMLRHEVVAAAAQAQSLFAQTPNRGAKVLPFAVPQTRWSRMVHTAMQPRFAMTAAMAFFSIALSMNLAGVKLSGLRAADLSPKSVKKSFWSVNGRVVQYYDNLRVVYELESRVREMQRESDGETETPHGFVSKPESGDQQPTRQPSGQPRSSAPLFRFDGPHGLFAERHHHRFSVVRAEEQNVPQQQKERVLESVVAHAGHGEGVQA